jgi:hypothetical protein
MEGLNIIVMSNKTAMQELIHWLKIGWKDEDIDTVLKKAEQLLKVEKKQLIKAYKDGIQDMAIGQYYEPKHYYENNYGK